MYIVVRRGAFETIDEGGRLAGLAAVRALEEFGADPEWRARPGKVVLRARSPSQWARVLEEPHAAASDGVVALPPRRRSERGEALTKIQAMSTELEPPPEDAPGLVYALNPAIEMSSGKTLAQIAHAAVYAAELGYDVSTARVIAPKTLRPALRRRGPRRRPDRGPARHGHRPCPSARERRLATRSPATRRRSRPAASAPSRRAGARGSAPRRAPRARA